jgi:hypothetical protein
MPTANGRGLSLTTALLLATTVLAGPSAARADSPVEAGRVYVGGDGVSVAVVPLKPRTDNKALVRVTGSGTPFDDKVMLYERDDRDGGKVAYSTTYHGRSWYTITVPSSAEARPILIYLPGRREVTVKYDERKSAELKTDDVYRAYQKQQADGTLKALAAFNRKDETARHGKQLGETVDAFAKQCGAKLQVKVDWASFPDDDLKELSIASYCGEPIETMARLCEESAEAKRTIAGAIKTFTCKIGPEMQLDLAGTSLNWTTSRNARNMGDFARKVLEKKL